MAMDSTWIIDMYNWSIPSPMGPPALIAPFWDYFHPETLSSSGIYYHYDAANHRFIIQWSRIHHMHGFRNPYPAEQQTFQVLLLNPTYYPTRTGDGPIIFQYHTVFNDDSASVDCHNYATVGIESPNLLDGIEYTFANHYPSAAAIIEPGRAIKFTTNPPDTFTAIKELNHYVINNPKFFSIFPNPIKSYTNFYYSLSHDGMVSLKVYDITGKIKLNLIDNKYHSAGQYQLKWQNQKIPAGIYFAILSIKNNDNKVNQKIKMILN
ncbi:MAG: T9SS type A sorting domain-containing protein [candidate division WOR-3 bacterium]